MKRLIAAVLTLTLLSVPAAAVDTLYDDAIVIQAPSACLMEKATGQALYDTNAHEHRPIANVTKVMTLLLVMEALDNSAVSRDDIVTASKHAASMGGSQIWLEEG